MAKYVYPAVFHKDDGMFSVNFPDLECCYTQGDTLQEALEMAEDVLCLTLYRLEEDNQEISAPSDLQDVKLEKGAFASLVTCDTLEYRQLYDSKAVKKTLTIPSWLNTMSEKQGVNFSMVLQNALKKELHIAER